MDKQSTADRSRSRRDFLNIACTGLGAAIVIGLTSSSAQAANKMPHGAVKYQDTPKGDQRCDNCALWEPPSGCKLVQDPIAPNGWCILYKKK